MARRRTDLLPVPPEWTTRRHVLWWWLRTGERLAVLLAALWVVWGIADHDLSWWLAFAAVPVAGASVLSRLVRVNRGAVELSGVDDGHERGVHIYNSLLKRVVWLAGVAACGIILFQMSRHLGEDAIRWLPDSVSGLVVEFLWGVPAIHVIVQVKSGLPIGWLALTPDRIYYRHVGGTPTQVLHWEDVADVRAESARGDPVIRVIPSRGEDVTTTSRTLRELATRYAMPRGSETISSPTATLFVPARHVEMDPVVVLHALHYYHRHRSDRTELDREAGARRVLTRSLC